MGDCVFCAIVASTEPATIVRRWPDALAIVPLHPVTDGHVLVLPTRHVESLIMAPGYRVAEYAGGRGDYNLILSQGPAATQTIAHLHWHYIPRRPGDGLALPWTGQAVA